MLDAQEYLHLAITSSRQGQHQDALEQLHRCLEITPHETTATFLLAAEHAELGLYDRAIAGMEAALSNDPELDIARLQLGMLYATTGNGNKAMENWHQLKASSKDEAISLFAQGFAALYQGEREEAQTILTAAMTANTSNPALNTAAEQVLAQSEPQNFNESRDSESEKPKDSLYLGAYSSSAIGDQ